MTGAPRKLAFFLPNTFTALNMACGFFSVILSWRGEFQLASVILILGAVFDMVDGRVARLTGTQSAFGEQFDSISDVVSFGVAPAFLVYNRFFIDLGRIGLVTSFLFLLCGALRLARFNANIDKVSSDFFQGLPIPTGALSMIGLTLFSLEFPEILEAKKLFIPYVWFFSFLMISNIPFNSFKNSAWVKSHKKRVFLLIMGTLLSTAMYHEIMIMVVVLVYVLGSLFYYFKNYNTMGNMFDWKSEYDEEH
jgi:CDP-diacylglycerol--serine O-phosphatidyltransferase